MSFDFVGLENLPNVYFEKIELYDNDDLTFKVKTSLLLQDEVYDSSFIWTDDPLMFDYLKVGVICTSNIDLISRISNGEINAHPAVIRRDRALMSGTHIQSVSVKEMMSKADFNTRRYKGQVSFLKSLSDDSVVLFAFTYIDTMELAKTLRIKLTGPLNYYYGSVVSEDVFRAGVLEEATYVYRKADGMIWKGPVHQDSDGNWMTGSFRDDNSQTLTREEVKNTKILDRRMSTLRRRTSSLLQNKPVFSELSTSYNAMADLIGLFSIDYKSLIYNHTKHGRKMFNVSQKLFEQVANSIELNSIEIRRKQVKQVKSNNRLGTPTFKEKLIGSYRTIEATIEKNNVLVNTDKMSQIFVLEDPFVKTYQFIDSEMSERTRGEFRYEVVITLIDKTDVFLRSIVAQMKREIAQLKTQKDLLFRPSRYNREMDALRERTVVPTIFSQAIETYYENLSFFMDVSEEEKVNLVRTKKNMFTKDNYLNSEAEKLISLYSELITKFKVVFDLRESDSNFSRKDNTRKAIPAGLISISHTFDSNIKFNRVASSYDYLGISDNTSMLTFSRDEYLKRADDEVSRFFDTNKAMSSSDLVDMDEDDAKAIMDLNSSKLAFFSPISFKFGNKNSNLTSLSTADTDSISVNFISHIEEDKKQPKVNTAPKRKSRKISNKRPTTNKRVAIKKRKSGKMNFNFRKLPLKINNLKQDEYLDVSKFLGQNSEMNNVENNLEQKPEQQFAKQVKGKVEIASGLTPKREKKSFDLTAKNNIIEKFKASPAYSVDKLRMIPVSIKSLLASRSSAAKNNILEADSDIMKDPETKVSTEMIFHATQRIQYLSGFEMDSEGNANLSKPKWVDMSPEAMETQPRMLCRMVYAEIPELEIKPATEFKLLAQNSHFIISNESLGVPIVATDVDAVTANTQFELPEVNEIVYASSNYVKQNSFRKNLIIKDEE